MTLSADVVMNFDATLIHLEIVGWECRGWFDYTDGVACSHISIQEVARHIEETGGRKHDKSSW